MPLPDFLVIGSPKAGSTALHAALARHPGLYLSPLKETKFFLCDGPPTPGRGPGDAHSTQEWVWRRSDYEALFEGAPAGLLRGESTPFYLWDTAAHVRIKKLLPEVRLIAVLRDPVARAYSNWGHLWCDGLEPEGDFLRACDLEEQRVADGWAPFWLYQGLGRYGEQVEHLLSVFPAEQVHLLRYRELVDEPEATLDAVCRFLGVATGVLGAPPAENVSTWVDDTPVNRLLRQAIRVGAAAGAHAPPQVWRQTSRPLLAALHRRPDQRPSLPAEARRVLAARFADDVKLLESVTGRTYADWLDADSERKTFSQRRL